MSVSHGRKIAVIGLGYVGLPVAVAFARSGAPVVGFDIDPQRIGDLHAGRCQAPGERGSRLSGADDDRVEAQVHETPPTIRAAP